MSSTIHHRMPAWNQVVSSASLKSQIRKLIPKLAFGRGISLVDDVEISNVHSTFIKSTVLFPENAAGIALL